MPLPSDPKTPWPLPGWGRIYSVLAEHSAWYSGDSNALMEFYGKATQQTTTREQWWKRFWRRAGTSDDPTKRYLHLPIAGDIASTAADLLFSEAPAFTIPEAEGTTERDEEGNEKVIPGSSDAIAAFDRLEELIEENGIQNTLLEGADLASGLGGVFLRPTWDSEVVERPVLSLVHQDQAFPEFSFGVLTAVTFYEEIAVDGQKVYRHLERHEKGVILHGLYEGTTDTLGKKIDLKARPETSVLAGSDSGAGGAAADQGNIQIDYPGGLLVRYVPNVLPNRRMRGSYLGRADFDGCEGLMDALDETWTSWMRDIRLGVARILVANEFLERGVGAGVGGGPTKRAGQGAFFNTDQEVFTPLDMDPSSREGAGGIEPIQFEIRTEAHLSTCRELVAEIVSKAGYSANSFRATDEATAESGKAIKLRERKSFRTTGRKERYWRTPVEDSLQALLWIDAEMFGRDTPVEFRPRMTFGDAAGIDVAELAQTATALAAAEAASIETRVRLVNPEMGDDEVMAEVAKIKEESSMNAPLLPEPTGGNPTPGIESE